MDASLKNLMIVFMGGGLGACLRFFVAGLVMRFSGAVPVFYGTLLVNVLGCLLIGLLAGFFSTRAGISQGWWLFLATGLLGGFTTYSAFSLDALQLFQRAEVVQALSYVLFSVIGCVLAAYAGFMIMRAH